MEACKQIGSHLMLDTHVDPAEESSLLFIENTVNLPHGWEIKLV